ncbi:hypothetical protein CY34DRAFT_431644 [Suillus luteus UH-Slu-Lm8-n1]|uniref:Uncharacterized protein n=1 Tax=Suillus luteus UH-Slu-Lm8-n1 TaxID=930992 RepID=A0A0D0BHF5_9AGAM|nr:hypothetical protein CY34DRAFT_431644 [Suillus luteus UH-Slu-Lm8-n1]
MEKTQRTHTAVFAHAGRRLLGAVIPCTSTERSLDVILPISPDWIPQIRSLSDVDARNANGPLGRGVICSGSCRAAIGAAAHN